MEHSEALKIAESFLDLLKPTCERIEIAGSIRRGKPEVKDIELLAIPILEVPKPRFGEPIFPRPLERILWQLKKQDWMIEPVKSGEKYKQFWIMMGGLHVIKIDLFLVTPPAQWGVLSVIRTGPDDFSHWMVTQKSKGGALPDGFRVQDAAVFPGEAWLKFPSWDTLISMPEEKDFFEFCDLPFVEPSERQARWGEFNGVKSGGAQ